MSTSPYSPQPSQPARLRAAGATIVDDFFPAEILASCSPIAAQLDDLLDAERSVVAASVQHRQREFATGRVRARELLARLGAPTAALLPGAERAPVWPSGFVGSISHAPDLCLVAVGRLRDVAAIGVDIEMNEGLDEEVWDLICSTAERRWLDRQPSERRAQLTRVLFCAKECTYKLLFPRLRTPFEPSTFEISLDLEREKFSATTERIDYTVAGSIGIRGRWIIAAASEPAAQPPSAAIRGKG